MRISLPKSSVSITPFLWFDHQAEEAARQYVGLFRRSRITRTTRYSEAAAKASGRVPGSVMTVAFDLAGQPFVALNGGPHFVVACRSQAELDRVWDGLAAGGKELPCGWLTDRYGVTWQVVPAELNGWLDGRDPARAERVMQALLRMGKLDCRTLRRAAGGGQKK